MERVTVRARRRRGIKAFVLRLVDDVDRTFSALFQSHDEYPDALPVVTRWPKVDVSLRHGSMVVRADLPGVKRSDLFIELEGRELSISGQRLHDPETREEGSYKSERWFGRFSRTVSLPLAPASSGFKSSLDQGVLNIEIEAAAAPSSPRH